MRKQGRNFLYLSCSLWQVRVPYVSLGLYLCSSTTYSLNNYERRHIIELTLFLAGLIATATAWIIKEFIFRPLQEQLYRSEKGIKELSSNIKELTECIANMKVSSARLAMELEEVKRRVDKIEDIPSKSA